MCAIKDCMNDARKCLKRYSDNDQPTVHIKLGDYCNNETLNYKGCLEPIRPKNSKKAQGKLGAPYTFLKYLTPSK